MVDAPGAAAEVHLQMSAQARLRGAAERTATVLLRSRFLQQFCALYRKNFLVAWRNRRATAIRLLAPFLFMLLALLIQKALDADNRRQSNFAAISTPVAIPVGYIPSCNSDLFIADRACYDFVYSPSGDTALDGIVDNIRKYNVPAIAAAKVKSFATRGASDAYLLANPETVLAAVHFFKSGTDISFVLQHNTTAKYFKGKYQDPNLFVQIPLASAVHREIARFGLNAAGGASATAAATLTDNWTPTYFKFPHPALTAASVLGYVLGPFIFAAFMFSFVAQTGAVSGEKELGLRQALRNMGMRDAAYWASWAAWDITFAFLTAHLVTVFGLILQFDMFLRNNYGLLWMLFFLFQLPMSAIAYMLSAIIQKSQTAMYAGFAIFLVGWITQTVVIFGVPFSPSFVDLGGGHITRIFAAMPWNLLAKGTIDLSSATNSDDDPGLSWGERASYCQDIADIKAQPAYDPKTQYINFKCVYPLDYLYKVLVLLYFVYMAAAIYLDNVLANESGVKRAKLYFLSPSYWFPRPLASHVTLARAVLEEQKGRNMPPAEEATVDEDVLAEELKMRELMAARLGDKDGAEFGGGLHARALEVYGLRKVFGAKGGCCTRGTDFWAVKGSWFSIEENQLFCLLGPNGAGKTTTINCLTGVLPFAGGDALVYGESIAVEGGMDRTRALMGVCPQFDVLWGELTGAEHLEIYGHVKGIPSTRVASDAADLLEKVKLSYAGAQRSGAYSGGMKRRLSVAIALLGNPRVVYLDEPTTGMDPISRRYVWDIIQESKKDRAIVLTTHSMEEADILGDRIAIMARGRLRCIGNSIRLKQKFGAGYQVSVSVLSTRGSTQDLVSLGARADKVKEYFKAGLGVSPVEETRAYMTFLVARDQEAALIGFLQRLETERAGLGITDIQLSLTSLEEVFLAIARKAEVEYAQASGGVTAPVTTDAGVLLQVPLGEERFTDAKSGITYTVRWGQDESGKLMAIEAQPLAAANGRLEDVDN